MLWKFVHLFRAAFEELQEIRYKLVLYIHEDVHELKEEDAQRLKSVLSYVAKCSHSVNLDATKHLAEVLEQEVKAGMNSDEVDAKIEYVQEMARKELKERTFFYVPNDRASYFNNKSASKSRWRTG
jgi:hypothetical protein